MTRIRCAIYTRKSSEEGLDQDFNSLDAQREACEAYVSSQRHEGWVLLKDRYDDGGISGGHLDRPGLQQLMQDIDGDQVDQIVVYKIDRLTRSLPDFAKLVERLHAANASFVSVTQSFNTSTSMGRLTLNVLLSFAQFEREVTAERIRDKIAASKKKGLWMGGNMPLGYDADGRTLQINPAEAKIIRTLFDLYDQHGTVSAVTKEADQLGLRSKIRTGRDGQTTGGVQMGWGQIHAILSNPVYAGRIRHKQQVFEGLHEAIIDPDRWETVQVKLTSASAKSRGPTTARNSRPDPSSLAGKMFDETGDRLTPTHANKKGRRYRYYVSHRLVDAAKSKRGRADDHSGWRLPARRLESDLATAIQTHLQAAVQTGRIMVDGAGDLQRLQASIAVLGRDALTLIDRVDIASASLTIRLDASTLQTALAIAAEQIEPDILTTTSPTKFRRRGVEARFTIGDQPPERDDILITNLAKADAWRRQIIAGKLLAEIAAEEAKPTTYIASMLDFGFLAPEIVMLCLAGQHPAGLTTNRLRRHGLPLDWAEQQRLIADL